VSGKKIELGKIERLRSKRPEAAHDELTTLFDSARTRVAARRRLEAEQHQAWRASRLPARPLLYNILPSIQCVSPRFPNCEGHVTGTAVENPRSCFRIQDFDFIGGERGTRTLDLGIMSAEIER